MLNATDANVQQAKTIYNYKCTWDKLLKINVAISCNNICQINDHLNIGNLILFFFTMAQQPLGGQGLLIIEDS